MKTRSEFVAMVAAQLLIDGKSPADAAAEAEALGLNLEKRNIAFWQPDPEDRLLVETFQAGTPTSLCSVMAWAYGRWRDREHPASSIILPAGAYRISVSALDKTPNKP